MTVALLLAAAPDRLSARTQPYRRPGDRVAGGRPRIDGMDGRLVAVGVRQIEVAMCADAADGLRAVAATARSADDSVLVCASGRAQATTTAALAMLLSGPGTAALTDSGALLVARDDLPVVAVVADALAARIAAGERQAGGRKRQLSPRRVLRRTRVGRELSSAVRSLIEDIDGNGVQVESLTIPGDRPPSRGQAAADQASQGNRPSQASQTGQPSRTGQPGQTGEPSQTGQAGRTGQPSRTGEPGRTGQPSRSSQSGQGSPAETGLLATFVVAPLAGRIARWAAARSLTPDALTIAAFALGGCAAAWFAAGTRRDAIAGAVLLAAALPLRQAQSRLAARSALGPAAVAFGSWLESATSAIAEYAVYAGLAAGWTAARPRQAWELATAAMAVLAVRQMTDACYASAAERRAALGPPGPAAAGHRLLRLAGQSIAMPAAERTAAVCVIAPVWGPRLALSVLLGWGVVAFGYSLAERAVASLMPTVIGDGGDSGGERAARTGAR